MQSIGLTMWTAATCETGMGGWLTQHLSRPGAKRLHTAFGIVKAVEFWPPLHFHPLFTASNSVRYHTDVDNLFTRIGYYWLAVERESHAWQLFKHLVAGSSVVVYLRMAYRFFNIVNVRYYTWRSDGRDTVLLTVESISAVMFNEGLTITSGKNLNTWRAM